MFHIEDMLSAYAVCLWASRITSGLLLSVCVTCASAKTIYIDCDNIPPPLSSNYLHSISHQHRFRHYSRNHYVYVCRIKGTCHHNVISAYTGYDPAGVAFDPIFTPDLLPSAIPELSTWAMMLLGLTSLGLATYARERRCRHLITRYRERRSTETSL